MKLFARRSWVLALALTAVLAVSCGGGGEDEGENDTRDVVSGLVEDAGPETLVEEEPYENIGFIPEGVREDQIRALERANWYRWMCGVPQLDMVHEINLACQSHCDYYVTHIDQYNSTGSSPHNENPSWSEGFSGVAPWDRMEFFGYNQGASEVIAFLHNAEGSVDGWMNTLYHRIPFMDATLTACGYGAAGTGNWQNSSRIDTMDFGWNDVYAKGYSGPPVVGIYPPPESTGIPPSFDGLESPQPPVPPTGYPSGTIISVTWSEKGTFMVADDGHRIWKDGEGAMLEHTWLDSFNDSNLQGAKTVSMYTHDPLEKGTKYWVYIKGTRGGADWEKEWWFITARY